MSGASGRYGSTKEVQAVTTNLKEARLLGKAKHTIKLEQSYALKLLQLNQREVKIRQKWLKSRVSKIKSHLTSEQIVELRALELDGKLKPAHSTINLSSMRIAAAARRLKLGQVDMPRSARRAHSAYPTVGRCVTTPTAAPYPSASASASTATRATKKSHSVNQDVFADAIEVPVYVTRPGTARTPVTVTSLDDVTPAAPRRAPSMERKPRVVRPASSGGFTQNRPPPPPPPAPRGVRPQTAPGPGVLYSCHHHEGGATESASPVPGSAAPSRRPPTRRASQLGDVTLAGKLVRAQADEMRHVLLDEESAVTAQLDVRRRKFLLKTDQWVQETPAITVNPVEGAAVTSRAPPPAAPSFKKQVSVISSGGGGNVTGDSHKNHSRKSSAKRTRKGQQQQQQQQQHPDLVKRQDTLDTQEAQEEEMASYKQQLLDSWKDLNKCRYLRTSDDKIDLSGVSTLAKDNYKLFEILRARRVSLSEERLTPAPTPRLH